MGPKITVRRFSGEVQVNKKIRYICMNIPDKTILSEFISIEILSVKNKITSQVFFPDDRINSQLFGCTLK